jgi:hypothetical protein
MSAQVVGTFQMLVCSVEIARVAKEVGRFSFCFTSSKAAKQV